MKIAILGWGSLIWEPKDLNFDSSFGWRTDGPVLPIEFSRISNDGRLTLVITADGTNVPTLFTTSEAGSLQEAIRNLSQRERSPISKIGFYEKSTNRCYPKDFLYCQNIKSWIVATDFDAVIWTNLAENWKEKTADRIVYLRNLENDKMSIAKTYINNAPEQIKTTLRVKIEQELAW